MSMKEILVGKNPSPVPVCRLVVGDARSQKIRILMFASDGGVDLTGMLWSVHFKNARHAEDITYIGSATQNASGGTMYVDWVVPPLACAVPGETVFEVTGTVTGNDGVERVWTGGTRVLKVFPGLNDIPPEEREELMTLHQMVLDLKTRVAALQAAVTALEEAST